MDTFTSKQSSSDELAINVVTSSRQEENLAKPPPNVGTWWSSRFRLAYLAFFGFANVYALRVNLSVAIVKMVNASYQTPSHNYYNECSSSNLLNSTSTAGFNWTRYEQGLVLGAFFYGYILTQIPGGYIASRFGGKYVFGGGVLCTSILTLFTPLAANYFPLLIALRILEGIGEGVTFPAMHAIWGAWAPPVERSRLVSLTYAGCHFGTVIAQPIAGVLCASDVLGGWPSVFYLYGIVGIAWSILWFIFAKNYPRESNSISLDELQYIEANVQSVSGSPPVPWKEIALSKSVWAISIAHFCNNWGFYTLLTCLPLYLKEVLGYDITQDGFIAALPYLTMWISINFFGYLADLLRGNGTLNTTQTRKVFNGVAFIGPAIFLVATGYVGCDKAAAIALICIATAFNGASFPGFNSNHIDLASRFSGILMGITNTWGTIPGFVSPAVVGALTDHEPSRHNWTIVFYISAAIYLAGTIAYTAMASGVEKDWNKLIEKVEREERTKLLDSSSDDDN